jgi:hypothetical protein
MKSTIHFILKAVTFFTFVFSTSLVLAQTATPSTAPVVSPANVNTGANTTQQNGEKNQKKGKGKKGKGKNGNGKKGEGKGAGAVCKGDAQLYCKGMKNRNERRACLAKNKEVLTPGCKAFIEKVGAAPGTTKPTDTKIEVNSASVPAKPTTTPSATPATKATTPPPAATTTPPAKK